MLIFRQFLLFISAFYFTVVSHAAPVINLSVNASGLIQGDTLTITGSGFGVKAIAKPLLWADFNLQLQPTEKGRRTQWSYAIANRELNSVITAANANQSIRWDHAASSDAFLGVQDIRDAQNQRTQKLYVFARKRYDYDLIQNANSDGLFNLKMYRFWGDIDAPPGIDKNHIFWNYFNVNGDVSASMYAAVTEGGIKFSQELPHKPNAWLVHELIYDAGTSDVQNGVYDLFEEGKKWYSQPFSFMTHNADHPKKYEDFFFDQVSNGTDAGPNYVYYDEIYMDTTWQRVVICDAVVFNRCSKRAIQIPTAWTDNQITVELNLGEFASFNEPLWLYVFDENGEPNAQGVPMVCENCPTGIGIEGEFCFPIQNTNGKTAMVCL